MIKKIGVTGLIICLIIACKTEDKTEQEISKIPMDFQVKRFDKTFAEATPEDLPRLKKDFPYLFPKEYPDSLWVGMINDTIQHQLNQEVAKKFPDFSEEKEELRSLFQHIKYYFPEFTPPTVITLTSEVDYKHKVIIKDSLLLIALDTYLGDEHKFYDGMQVYMKKNFRASQIYPDIVTEYASQLVSKKKSRTLLARMVYYGKLLYLADKFLPHISDAEKIGYTQKEMEWAETNEVQIWRYFIDRELLYETDADLASRFINLAPFTKFKLQLDNESPPQLGQYVGWQIVRQFVEKNDEVSLKELLQLDAETIFDKSNYKPRKP